MSDLSEAEREARTPGRRLHDRLEGSEVSSGSRYYDLMNPAVKAAWEQLATDIDKEMGGLGVRLNDAERDREQAEARERALRKERDIARFDLNVALVEREEALNQEIEYLRMERAKYKALFEVNKSGAERAEAQVRELRKALETIAKNDEGWGVGLSRKPSAIARAALASSGSKGPPLRGRKSQWRWWCSSCKRYTDIAPCKHCGAGHEEVLVLEPGQEPPSLKVVEADGWPTVEDFEWPPETYLNVEQGGEDD